MTIKANDNQHSNQVLLEGSALSAKDSSQFFPSAEQNLDHIDAEISHLRAIEAVGGWNTWGLIGASVAVGVLLLSSLETATLNFTNAAFWFICFSLITDGLLSWFIPGGGALVKSNKETRTRPGFFFRHRRPLFVATLMRDVVLIVIVLATGNELEKVEPGLLFIFAAVYYIMKGLEMIGWLLTTNSNDWWPDRIGRGEGIRIIQNIQSAERSFAVFITIISLLLAYAYAHAAGFVSLGQVVPESLRVGFLMAILLYIVLWLIDATYKTPLIDELLGIRRDLVFGRIMEMQAISKMEDILYGGPPIANMPEIRKKEIS